MRIFLSLAVALLWSSGALAQNAPAAQRVFDRARKAQGGAPAWNALRGLHAVGPGYERWDDPVRFGFRFEVIEAEGRKRVEGYNGAGAWRVQPGAAAEGFMEPSLLAEVRSDAYFGAYGYFYGGRFNVRSSLIGGRQAGGKSYDVIRVEPGGGEARELWFDRRTGLLTFMVDAVGPRQGRTEYSDYRRAGPLTLPFKAVTTGGGRPAAEDRTLTLIDFPLADRAMFSLARPVEDLPPIITFGG